MGAGIKQEVDCPVCKYGTVIINPYDETGYCIDCAEKFKKEDLEKLINFGK
jgi:hypothetical protein